MTNPLPVDEFPITTDTVATLLAAQFPDWAQPELTQLDSPGTDHRLFRIGERLLARLPRSDSAAQQTAHVVQWLPQLAPQLPIAVSPPVAVGIPGPGYPFTWTIVPWVAGVAASTIHPIGGTALRALGDFLGKLHTLDITAGPGPGPQNFWRGGKLYARDRPTRAAFDEIAHEFSQPVLTKAWETAIAAPGPAGSVCWIHGDIAPGNIILDDDNVAAVIDWGGMAVGDPACDYASIWSLAEADDTPAWKLAENVDAAIIARARGWALSIAAIQLAYYGNRKAELAAQSRRTISAVIAEFG